MICIDLSVSPKILRRALSFLLLHKDQTHQPGGHRPRAAIEVALDHYAARIAWADFHHSDYRVSIGVSAANQVKILILSLTTFS